MVMEKLESTRIGTIMRQPEGYDAFIPHKLGSQGLDINIDLETIKILDEAGRALGELKGVTNNVPNPDLFIAPYVKKEALLSSQIEGTECSLEEVLKVDEERIEMKPVHEVVNYIDAMNEGLSNLAKLPVCLRLINHIHRTLLKGVRGEKRSPGEYKKHQNWIGPEGCQISEAVYIPPPPNLMNDLMHNWEAYYHAPKDIPPLIEAAILHFYFETIHPYSDGNGRIGRLLITFMLCERGVLNRPLLYLSLFFKEYRKEYYRLLMDVRLKGQIEEWIKFFLRGVRNTSQEALKTVREIEELIAKHSKLVKEKLTKHYLSISLFDLICELPIISISSATRKLGGSYPTLKQCFENFINLGILHPYGTKKRNKLFIYSDYVDILRKGT